MSEAQANSKWNEQGKIRKISRLFRTSVTGWRKIIFIMLVISENRLCISERAKVNYRETIEMISNEAQDNRSAFFFRVSRLIQTVLPIYLLVKN